MGVIRFDLAMEGRTRAGSVGAAVPGGEGATAISASGCAGFRSTVRSPMGKAGGCSDRVGLRARLDRIVGGIGAARPRRGMRRKEPRRWIGHLPERLPPVVCRERSGLNTDPKDGPQNAVWRRLSLWRNVPGRGLKTAGHRLAAWAGMLIVALVVLVGIVAIAGVGVVALRRRRS